MSNEGNNQNCSRRTNWYDENYFVQFDEVSRYFKNLKVYGL